MKLEKLIEGWPWVWKWCKSIRKAYACYCKRKIVMRRDIMFVNLVSIWNTFEIDKWKWDIYEKPDVKDP
jgi:hypothetical protein